MSASRRRSGAVPRPQNPRPGPPQMRPRGAQAHASRTARGARVQLVTWFGRHAQASVSTAGGLARAPIATALTVTIIGIALALPAGLLVGLSNLRAASGGAETAAAAQAAGVTRLSTRMAPTVSLYLAPEAGDDGARALASELRSTVGGAHTRVITRAEALAEYREMAGFGASLESLGVQDNPLPAVVVLSLTGAGSGQGMTSAGMQALVEQLEARPEVELAQMDLAWLERLDAIVELLKRGVLVVSALFGLGVLLIVGNSVRLAVERRREEIEIARLFGATEAFVRRPFLYAGALYGLFGGILALLLVTAALLALEGPAARLAALYASGFELRNLEPGPGAALLAGAALLGVAGAWLSVGARLRAMEPG